MNNGSSPHAWGTRLQTSSSNPVYRFIPTRMGNTFLIADRYFMGAVHPHTHGEHFTISRCYGHPIGSSPHAWGTRSRVIPSLSRLRFIPTRMGNTTIRARHARESSVHPHTHGEHRDLPLLVYCVGGSSPHAWGTQEGRRMSEYVPRFIPTRMGNTPIGTPLISMVTVHPHTHGEHGPHNKRRVLNRGSSPHAWGTR